MNVYVLGTIAGVADLLRLTAGRLPISGVIGLSNRASDDTISGFTYMAPICEALGIPFIEVETYGLTSQRDIARLQDLEIDLLLVAGWQRLIPAWLIDHAKLGALGVHGSPFGITGGRGRSPQNWALILGERQFSLSLFFIDPGVDSGPVVASRDFAYDNYDDIATSYLKCTLATADMLIEAIESGAILDRRSQPQSHEAHYLPQRRPEDGAIDWTRSSTAISRFVAALTRPYPGAFTWLERRRLNIWRARPFQMQTAARKEQPGRIVLCAEKGALLVESGDGFVVVDEYSWAEPCPPLSPGGIFESADFSDQMRGIVEAHRQRHPDQPLSPAILAALES